MSHETYTRWHTDLSKQRHALKTQIDMLGQAGDKTSNCLQKELEELSNLKEIYHKATTIQKHELVRAVFDNRLDYKSGSYRTPYLLNTFQDNYLKNKTITNSFLQEKGENDDVFPSSGEDGTICFLFYLLVFY